MNVNQWGAVNQWESEILQNYNLSVNPMNITYSLNETDLFKSYLITSNTQTYSYSTQGVRILHDRLLNLIPHEYIYNINTVVFDYTQGELVDRTLPVSGYSYHSYSFNDLLILSDKSLFLSSISWNVDYNGVVFRYSGEDLKFIDYYTIEYKGSKNNVLRYS